MAKSRKTPKTEKPAPPQPGPIGRAVKALIVTALAAIWAVTWRLGAIVSLILVFATGVFFANLPGPDDLFDGRATGSVTLLDRQGSVFAWRGEQYGGELRASEVSPHLVHAVIAAEDSKFCNHGGFDAVAIAKAAAENAQGGRIRGGSTITQQTAKLLCLGNFLLCSFLRIQIRHDGCRRLKLLLRDGRRLFSFLFLPLRPQPGQYSIQSDFLSLHHLNFGLYILLFLFLLAFQLSATAL